MRHARQRVGDAGEELAAAYVRARGYRVIARNVMTPCGELDLVCRKGREVVFIEVKTRNGRAYGNPEEAVTRAKQAHLVRSAQAYLAGEPALRGCPFRIDVIAITHGTGAPEIAHIPSAVGDI